MQQESQRARQLQLERERERLQRLQQQQLDEAEFVLEQQRHFLTDANHQDVFVDGCEAVSCTTTSSGRPAAVTTRDQQAPSTDDPRGMFAFFSAEA